jgi:hypothetical protein
MPIQQVPSSVEATAGGQGKPFDTAHSSTNSEFRSAQGKPFDTAHFKLEIVISRG